MARKKVIGVYRITSPSGKVYIGASTNIYKRWSDHRRVEAMSQRKLITSFIKHGVDSHVFEILEECQKHELNKLETHYGMINESLTPEKGLNLSLPKDKKGNGGVSIEANFNRTPGSFKKGHESWNKGIPMKESTKLKLSKSKKGIPSKKKGIKTNIPSHNSKLILCLNTGIYYNSSCEASKYSKYSRQTINAMLDGKRANKTSLIYV